MRRSPRLLSQTFSLAIQETGPSLLVRYQRLVMKRASSEATQCVNYKRPMTAVQEPKRKSGPQSSLVAVNRPRPALLEPQAVKL